MDPLLSALVEAGVLPLAEAERLTRQLDPEQARLYSERTLIQAFANGLSRQQRRMLDLLDASEGQPDPRQLELFWDGENDLLWASVGDEMRSVALERAVTASIGNFADPDMWQMVNEEVLAYTNDYYTNADLDAEGSIPNLNITARTQFAQAFTEWQRGDFATMGYADGLPQLIRALEPTFGSTRAELVGITETTRIFSLAEQAAANANPFVEYIVYMTAVDEIVCPICVPGNNLAVPKGESTFSDGRGFPPRHPRCRCGITSVTGPVYRALLEEGAIRA
jgi:hypothetical protein